MKAMCLWPNCSLLLPCSFFLQCYITLFYWCIIHFRSTRCVEVILPLVIKYYLAESFWWNTSVWVIINNSTVLSVPWSKVINTRLTDGEGALLVDVTSTSGRGGGVVAELGQIQVRFRLLDAAPSVANVSQDVEGNDSHWDFSVSSLSLANFELAPQSCLIKYVFLFCHTNIPSSCLIGIKWMSIIRNTSARLASATILYKSVLWLVFRFSLICSKGLMKLPL